MRCPASDSHLPGSRLYEQAIRSLRRGGHKSRPDQSILMQVLKCCPQMSPGRVIAALLFVSVALCAQATIEGTVVNSVTRGGIEGVSVKFYSQQGVRYEATTGSGGSFSITGVKDGEYRSTLEREGFEPPKHPEFPAPEPTTRISVKDNVLHVAFELTPWTILHGRVAGSDGEPAAQIPVQIRGPIAGGRDSSETVSGADGGFTFNQLLPGTFTIVARPSPSKSPTIDGVRVEAVATYYPSAFEPSQAQEIAVRGLGEEAGYVIRLRNAPVHRVRGIVLDEAGNPAAGIRVWIAPSEGATSGWRSTLGPIEFYLPYSWIEPSDDNVLTGTDGTFDLPSVREGEWTIHAASEWEYQEDTRRDIQRLGEARAFVSRRDVDDVEIRLSSNFDVTVSVDWPDEFKSVMDRWVMATLWPDAAGAAVSARALPTGQMKEDGSLQFERVYPGRYFIVPMASGVPGAYVSEVQVGGRDILGQTIALSSPPPPIRIVYKSGAGSVHANIPKGTPATLLLIPNALQEGGFPRSVKCDVGTCELSDLRPGNYLVAAFDRVDGAKLSAYLPDLASVATRVRVEEGSKVALNLPVKRWPD